MITWIDLTDSHGDVIPVNIDAIVALRPVPRYEADAQPKTRTTVELANGNLIMVRETLDVIKRLCAQPPSPRAAGSSA